MSATSSHARPAAASPVAPALPALPAALQPNGGLARELRVAVASNGDCDGARYAMVLLGVLGAAGRAGARGPVLRSAVDAFVRRALADSHAPAVVDDTAARGVAAVDLLRLLHDGHGCAPDAGLLADLAATLERPPYC